jgi:hypothetical protein
MVGRDEAVLLRGRGDPFVEPALLDLDDAMAALAEEVMVMRVAAEPVALLAAVMGEDIDDALLAQERQRPVDRGQASAGVALAQPSPKLLGRHVVALAPKLLEHLEPSWRGVDAVPLEQLHEPLPRLRHIAILALVRMRTVIVLAMNFLAVRAGTQRPWAPIPLLPTPTEL